VKILPRLASARAFLCWMFAHLLCPAMNIPLCNKAACPCLAGSKVADFIIILFLYGRIRCALAYGVLLRRRTPMFEKITLPAVFSQALTNLLDCCGCL
jgi:hypothetical protein